jgi:GDSL-like Lipase/Acylhydrolase family
MRATLKAADAGTGPSARRGPTSSRRTALGVLGLLACLLCAVVPAGASAAGAKYVAMGDSYSSGPGILPVAEGAPLDCGQSSVNYPHLVASALKLTLTDVSCGGASTEDFTVAQHPDQPPQFDALGESTEIITVGMGGNDHNLFSTLVQGCSEIDTTNTTSSKTPCKDQLEGLVTKTLEEDKAPAEAALQQLKVLAPHAKVFVVGYPDITPKKGKCMAALPWTEGDLKWFRNTVQKHGNASLKAGAKANGAFYVDTFKASEGHDLCQPVGTRWIEPLFGSLTGVPVHPNAIGEEQDAFDVELAMLKAGVR